MIPRKFFDTASSQDVRFIRRWSVGVSVLYGIMAATVVALSFVLHAPNDTTVASSSSEAQQAILAH
jgi:hypothetical protein